MPNRMGYSGYGGGGSHHASPNRRRGSGRRGTGRRGRGGRGRGGRDRGNCRGDDNTPARNSAHNDDNCRYCGEEGHFTRTCSLKRIDTMLQETGQHTVAKTRQFLEEATAYVHGDNLVHSLGRSASSLDRFHTTLQHAIREDMLWSHVLPLLERLGRDDATEGLQTESIRLIGSLYKGVPDLLPKLVQHLDPSRTAGNEMPRDVANFFLRYSTREAHRDSRVSQADLRTLCWFLTHLIFGNHRCRDDVLMKSLVNLLTTKMRQEIPGFVPLATLRALMEQNQVLDQIAFEVGSSSADDMAGGRHDNDFANYHDIKTKPTAAELRCSDVPYLPPRLSPTAMQKLQHLALHNGTATEREISAIMESYLTVIKLDRQYRLLREDYVGPIRETLRSISTTRPQAPIYERVVLHDVHPRGLSFSVPLPRGHRVFRAFAQLFAKGEGRRRRVVRHKAIELQWKLVGGRTLSQGTIVAVFWSEHEDPYIGTVTGNDATRAIEAVEKAQAMPASGGLAIDVSIQFEEAAVVSLLEHMADGSGVAPHKFRLAEIERGAFAVEPVLERLQNVRTVPLAEELLMSQPSQGAPRYIEDLDVDHAILQLEERHNIRFDDQQREALQLALTNRVSLTQGPPGTGKTFVGAMLAEVLLTQNTGSTFFDRPTRILVMCETNHALDDFLKDLIGLGVGDGIVRVGGRCKESGLQQYTLHEKAKSFSFSKTTARQYFGLKREIDDIEEKLLRLGDELSRPVTWEVVQEHLRKTGSGLVRWLRVPDAGGGFVRVDKAGKELKQDYLFKRWLKGKDRGVFEGQGIQGASGDSPWTWPQEGRGHLYARWKQEITRGARGLCAHFLAEHQRCIKQLRQLRDMSNQEVLKRVLVACAAARKTFRAPSAPTDALVRALKFAGNCCWMHYNRRLHPLEASGKCGHHHCHCRGGW